VPGGVVDWAVFRDNGIQHKLIRMANGTELTPLTDAKKGTYSLRVYRNDVYQNTLLWA